MVAPLRALRVQPARRHRVVPDRRRRLRPGALAKALDQEIFNKAAASLYRDRFGTAPGIVYAAGVEHAYNLAREFRAAG